MKCFGLCLLIAYAVCTAMALPHGDVTVTVTHLHTPTHNAVTVTLDVYEEEYVTILPVPTTLHRTTDAERIFTIPVGVATPFATVAGVIVPFRSVVDEVSIVSETTTIVIQSTASPINMQPSVDGAASTTSRTTPGGSDTHNVTAGDFDQSGTMPASSGPRPTFRISTISALRPGVGDVSSGQPTSLMSTLSSAADSTTSVCTIANGWGCTTWPPDPEPSYPWAPLPPSRETMGSK